MYLTCAGMHLLGGSKCSAMAGANGAIMTRPLPALQEAAIASTTRRLGSDIPADQRPRLHLVCGCHSNILDHVPKDSAKLVCFNLGYLPSADKSVITKCGTTLEAIKVRAAPLPDPR